MSTNLIKAEKSSLQHVTSYVTDLRTLIGFYTGWADSDLVASRGADETEIFNTLANDDSVYNCMNLLSLMVAGENVEVVSPYPVLAEIVAEAFSYIEDFTHARKSLAHAGSLYGLGVQKKFWKKAPINGMEWWVPSRIREVDRRRMRLERETHDRDQVHWSIWSKKYDQYMLLKDREEVPNYEPGFLLQDFIFYISEYEEAQPFGRGLSSVLYPLAFVRQHALQYWADLAEHWSKPFIVMLTDAVQGSVDAELGAGFPSAREKFATLLNVIESARGRHQMVMDKRDDLKILENGNVSKNIIGDYAEYIDKAIQQVVLGSILTTSTGGGSSSYALGQIHKGNTNAIVMYHRERLEAVLERELMRDFFFRNIENLQRLGFDYIKPNDCRLIITTRSEMMKREILEKADSSGAAKLAVTM